MDYKKELLNFVSRETYIKIKAYVEFLKRWNKGFSLVSDFCIKEDFYNHIMEVVFSNQFIKDKNATLVDVGSGNGVIGITLGILGYKRCNLVERSFKKSVFLKEAAGYLDISVNIINDDIKNVFLKDVEYIVSKGVSNVRWLLKNTEHISSLKTEIIVYKKGGSIKQEIGGLEKEYKVDKFFLRGDFCKDWVVVKIKKQKAKN